MLQGKLIAGRVVALVLYLVTLVLGMMGIYFLRELFFIIYARLSSDNAPVLFWADAVVVLAAIGFVAFAIITGEYHRKHAGERRSWRLFAWTIVILVAMPLLVIALGGSA